MSALRRSRCWTRTRFKDAVESGPIPSDFSGMIDPFGRPITYLRVSVTDRCDLRCVYCMAEDMTFLPKRELLTLEELDRLSAAFIRRSEERRVGKEPKSGSASVCSSTSTN